MAYVSTLPEEILQKAKDELGEDDFLRQQSLDSIRQWLKKQPHLKAFPADGALYNIPPISIRLINVILGIKCIAIPKAMSSYQGSNPPSRCVCQDV